MKYREVHSRFPESFLGGDYLKEDMQAFIKRYDLGPPWPGITIQESVHRYNQLAANLSPAIYERVAIEGFAKVPREERSQFARYLRWQVLEQDFHPSNVDLDASEEERLEPTYLARLAASMYDERPAVYKQIFGPGMGGPTLSSDTAKAVLASLAVAAFKDMLSS